ncbi:MAG: hypothetical protein R3323_05040, partial [Wenzhouxiangellaceae bacterium]|nr:hypothetical protein [Wenzhouxiangellaceae bacterium]
GAVPGTGDALRWSGLDPDPVMPDGRIEGMRMDVSFGVHLGRVGDLLLDLQLERYRRSAGPSLALAPEPADFSSFTDDRVRHAGQLGLGWRGQRFGADLTGQVRELPAWLGGEDARHHSFDLELSWRSPINSTIRVGVTNLLDDVPDDNPGASMEGIFGRIPYVRYQHDL